MKKRYIVYHYERYEGGMEWRMDLNDEEFFAMKEYLAGITDGCSQYGIVELTEWIEGLGEYPWPENTPRPA